MMTLSHPPVLLHSELSRMVKPMILDYRSLVYYTVIRRMSRKKLEVVADSRKRKGKRRKVR
ncbi:hypothetical protein V1478_009737 [Vespula squamosa]|uniref:Uncharacterized protein n=1 Tax=Vespula squamosa TaxID=30214 RepID=A0ABD2AQI3_VESSQ